MDVVLILLLILLNGVFALSEMAVVSARKARLQNMEDEGSSGAAAALALQHEPSAFLSTIQVGITTVGILSGAVGEAAIADPLSAWLSAFPPLADYAQGIALTVTVVLLTYFSVVVGELVPKRLALLAPERLAAFVARPMQGLARLGHPLVVLLSGSCDLILRLVGARRSVEPPVTDDEIKVLMEQGAEAGVFHEAEQAIVSNVLRLDELQIGAIMTPRKDISLLDLEEPDAALHDTVAATPHTRLVVCRGGADQVVGVVESTALLRQGLAGQAISAASIEQAMVPPAYLPESVSATHLLEHFRRSRGKFALVVDEYGELQGLVTLTDVLTAIVGEMELPATLEEQDMVRRDDGSWLVDGAIPMERLKARLGLDEDLPGEAERSFHTLGGFVMHVLGRVPVPADHFHQSGFRFEVMDMDRNRVDKVLVQLETPPLTEALD